MTDQKKKSGRGNGIGKTMLGLAAGMGALVVLITTLLHGTDVILFNPKGMIATEEHKLMLLSAALLFAIAIPTLLALYSFAWKYRENQAGDNTMHNDKPASGQLRRSTLLAFWAIPCAFFVVLSVIMWSATQRLEPQKAIASDAPVQTIEVVAMRWKWLFIYPEHNIATVNFVEIPADVPIRFKLTADEASMSAFWIPHLSGMLYAMTGHMNTLNLVADTPGDYPGRTAEINGEGFAGMKFVARVSAQDEFAGWVRSVQQSQQYLDQAAYQQLLKPTENHPREYYSQADANIFAGILQKYSNSHQHSSSNAESGGASGHDEKGGH